MCVSRLPTTRETPGPAGRREWKTQYRCRDRSGRQCPRVSFFVAGRSLISARNPRVPSPRRRRRRRRRRRHRRNRHRRGRRRKRRFFTTPSREARVTRSHLARAALSAAAAAAAGMHRGIIAGK